MNREMLTRITVDIPLQDHKRLKALAALQGKSMREIILKSIDSYLASITNNAQFNSEKAEELFKTLGI